MIHLTTDELREKIDFSLIDEQVITEGFRQAGRGHHMVWTTMSSLEKYVAQYITEHGLDPETTLVYYSVPLAEEERKAREEETIRQINAGILDAEDYMQVGYVDPNQVMVSLYLNMTVEKLLGVLSGKVSLI